MKNLLFALCCLLALTISAQSAEAAAGPPNFQCPESLPTAEAQTKALENFLTWAQSQHRDWTLSQIVTLRVEVLKQHHCEETLANLKAAANSQQSDLGRRLCTRANGTKYFSAQAQNNCVPAPLEQGWVHFSATPAFIVDILPSKMVKERDGVKIWTQFSSAEAVNSDDGKWKYNHVKNISKFFCKQKQTVLIQGTYFLNGVRVYERSSREAIKEEIEPGTINEELYEYVCKK